MEFTGIVGNIRFHNEENGYTVFDFKTDDGDITAVGNTLLLSEGESIRLCGELIFHEKYGEQISFSSFEVLPPGGRTAIIAYLSSGLLPHIGLKIAEKIVNKFGEDTLDILQNTPERLLEIPGIGRKRIGAIFDAYKNQRELRELVIFLEGYRISTTIAIRVFRAYGSEAIPILKENPYRLAREIKGIGFAKADEIAQKLGLSADCEERISAGLYHILFEAAMEGDTYLPFSVLKNRTSRLLLLDDGAVYEGMKLFAMRKDITVVHNESEDYVYLRSYHLAENYVANKILAMLTEEFSSKINEQDINSIEKLLEIKYAKEQREVLINVFSKGVSIITGGPGTGKTTLINGIIRLAEEKNLRTLLAAPTGRAAKRMTEATSREAKTIHRLLEYGMGEENLGFQKNEDSPLEADIVIVDEISMVNIVLMNALMSALTSGMILIIVGDSDQLPAIGAGNVLKDLIDSKTVPIFRLNTIFRQKKSSLIVENAHNILLNKSPISNKPDGDFFFLNCESQRECKDLIVDLVKKRLPEYYDLDPLKEIQVLSPMKKGEVGTFSLNTALQAVLNPKSKSKEEKKSADEIFRVGDKVMQIRNNYTMEWDLVFEGKIIDKGSGVYNGDIGVIQSIDDEEVSVLFDNEKIAKYGFSSLDELVLSYAVTVHKSQGSEFPCVVMPIWGGPPMLLNRNLLYTAITRAKKLAVLVGEERFLTKMIENTFAKERYSSLGEKLSSRREMFFSEQFEDNIFTIMDNSDRT